MTFYTVSILNVTQMAGDTIWKQNSRRHGSGCNVLHKNPITSVTWGKGMNQPVEGFNLHLFKMAGKRVKGKAAVLWLESSPPSFVGRKAGGREEENKGTGTVLHLETRELVLLFLPVKLEMHSAAIWSLTKSGQRKASISCRPVLKGPWNTQLALLQVSSDMVHPNGYSFILPSAGFTVHPDEERAKEGIESTEKGQSEGCTDYKAGGGCWSFSLISYISMGPRTSPN